MSIWSKVLIGLIFVALLPFFYLSLRLLKTNEAWRTNVNKYTKAVADMKSGVGTQSGLSIEQLTSDVKKAQVALHEIVYDRGRVWRNVQPTRAFNANTGKGSVTVSDPVPNRIAEKMVLFAFDPNGYLGEFQVAIAGDQNITLEPTMKMSDRQLKRLSSSQGGWTLYEVMPMDRHDLYAGMDRETLEKMLPAARVNEFLKDGQPSEPNDPAERVVDGKYQRPLVDFTTSFHEMDREIAIATDANVAAQKDVDSLRAALADANRQVAFRTEEIAELKRELARTNEERELIGAQYAALSKQLAATREEMRVTFNQNRDNAKELAALQAAAVSAVSNAE